MSSITNDLIHRIDELLGLRGRPRLTLADGQWVDTGAYEWNPYLSPGHIWRSMSPALKQAMEEASNQLSHTPSRDDPMAGFLDYFSQNDLNLQDEYEAFVCALKEAEMRYQDPIEIPLPRMSHEFKAAMDKIASRVNEEMRADDDFDIDVYAARVQELWQMEPKHLRAELEEMKPQLDQLGAAPDRAAKARQERLNEVRDLLKGTPFMAYGDVVVAPAIDQFDILLIEQTNGANRGLLTEDIISSLEQLNDRYGLDIVNAGFDHVTFILKRIPTGDEAEDLGQSLLRLCPDLGEAPKDMAEGKVRLWWD